jgi:hypothetical protein
MLYLPELIGPDIDEPSDLEEAKSIISNNWSRYKGLHRINTLPAAVLAETAMSNVNMALEWGLASGHFRRLVYPKDGGELEVITTQEFEVSVQEGIDSITVARGWQLPL